MHFVAFHVCHVCQEILQTVFLSGQMSRPKYSSIQEAFAKLLEVDSVEANVMVVPSVSNSPVVLCNVKDVVKDVTVTSSNRPVPTVGVVSISVVLNEVLSNKVSE